MKFVILIFALLASISLCFKKLFDKKLWNSNEINPSIEPSFLENQNKMNEVNTNKNTLSSETSETKRHIKGYTMTMTIFKETDPKESQPTTIKGTIKLGKNFEVYGEDEKLKNQFSYLK